MTQMNQRLKLRPGDWVEVASAAEILSSLDESGARDDMPFMPEMLAYCGQRFQVRTRCERSCDPTSPVLMVRVEDTVHLDDLRCNGQSHGGCQMKCLLFWKESWLKRSSPGHQTVALNITAGKSAPADEPNLRRDATWLENQMRPQGNGTEALYRCQATELRKSATPLPWWKPAQYFRDVWPQRVPIARIAMPFVYMGLRIASRILSRKDFPNLRGTLDKTPTESLGLQAGDWVVVKFRDEIVATLDKTGRNRGMTFEASMLPYCGKRCRVAYRVEQVVDERTGKLRKLAEPTIVLSDVVCDSPYGRTCSRSNYLFWREIWLRRVDAGS